MLGATEKRVVLDSDNNNIYMSQTAENYQCDGGVVEFVQFSSVWSLSCSEGRIKGKIKGENCSMTD